MRTQVFYYAFDTRTKPGKMIAHGIRFESLEVDCSEPVKLEAQFPILCSAHKEITDNVILKHFKECVAKNL